MLPESNSRHPIESLNARPSHAARYDTYLVLKEMGLLTLEEVAGIPRSSVTQAQFRAVEKAARNMMKL